MFGVDTNLRLIPRVLNAIQLQAGLVHRQIENSDYLKEGKYTGSDSNWLGEVGAQSKDASNNVAKYQGYFRS
ncbi:hypothetical protein BTJ40_13655 [Microbulbifer sp. A4B17]|nr:hypothetical protein BTJ40_13655 [Microbulbifer sp. A4B17]